MPVSSASRPWMAARIRGLNVCVAQGRARLAVEEYTDVLSWVWAAPDQTLDSSGGQEECHMAYAGPVPRASSLGIAKEGLLRAPHHFLGLAVDRVGAAPTPDSHCPLRRLIYPPMVNRPWTSVPKTWLPSSSLQTLGIGEGKNEAGSVWEVEA